MSVRLQPLSSPPEQSTAARFTRRVTLDDVLGVGQGPRQERTALLTRQFESQYEVLERYYGSWVAVAVALVRDPADPARERLEVVCAPDVDLEQNVEELLFRAYSLY